MIQPQLVVAQVYKYIGIVLIALVLMIAGSLSQQSQPVAAATCNVVLTDYDLPGDPRAFYYNDGFFDDKCVNSGKPFPNTGLPYSSDGNVDSVGYVIPREYKSTNYDSEALSYVNTKDQFYDKLRHHYFDRVPKPATTQEHYWAKDGAAFVVYSLIGKNPPADRNLTDADWNELKRRLDNPKLTLSIDDDRAMSPNSGAVYDTDGRLDFTHFYDEMGLRGPALVFKVGTVEVASIERKCANLLGQVELPEAPPWTTTASSKVGVNRAPDYPPNVDSWTAQRGDLVTWRHTITAKDANAPGLNFYIGKSGFSGTNIWGTGLAANHSEPSGTTTAIAKDTSYSIGWGANYPSYSEYIVQASDGGRTLCQSVTWGPTDYTQVASQRDTSAAACVDVPYNYNLKPSVDGPSGVVTVGSPIGEVMPSVDNSLVVNPGKTTDSPVVEWQMKRIEIAPNAPSDAIPRTVQESANDPCTHYRASNNNDCQPKGNGTRTFQAGSVTMTANELTGEMVDPDTEVGTEICYTLSVKPYSQTDTRWRHSAPVCVKVSKSPKVQVWGHDVRTRGSIQTKTTSVTDGGTNKVFGSWVEYGGFSASTSSNFASGAGLNNGNVNPVASAWSKLTFANVNAANDSDYGKFTLPSGLPTITSQFIGGSSPNPFDSNIGALSSGTYQVDNVDINASSVGQDGSIGKSIIIVSSGTVKITGNITYTGPGAGNSFSQLTEIPQVVIIARNIVIEEDVTQIDAWLLTTPNGGYINTCLEGGLTDALIASVCDEPLTVNGPVVTQHLYLRRTAGSDTVATAGAPAETFNLRSDVYLWAQMRASQAGKAQTVYSVELPPRF